MKKVFTLLSMVLLGLASLPSQAQFKLGVTVGVSSNSFGYDYEDSDDEEEARDITKAKIGYKIGLAAEYSFVEAVSLQTGVMLSNKGAKYEAEEDGDSFEATNSISYAEIPLNLAFKVSNFQVHAGPYIGIGLAGKMKSEYNIGGETGSEEIKYLFKNEVSESDLEDSADDEDFIRRTDVGLNLGAGYRVGPVLVTATYSKGFSNITPSYEGDDDSDNDKRTHKGISLAATWFF